MKKMSKPPLPPGTDPTLQRFVTQVVEASQVADGTDIGGAFTITGTYTTTRNLNVTAPSLANIAAVLATLLADLKAGGANRTT